MTEIFPRKVECPHCRAINPTWGWSEQGECSECHKHYEVKLIDTSESVVEKIIEKVDGLWDEDKEDAKFVD